MKRYLAWSLSLAVCFAMASRAAAFTSQGASSTVSVSASGVSPTKTLSTQIVQQNTADVPTTLSFGSAGNTFRDSNAAIKLSVDTNLALNRVIIYTSNLGTTASPKFCDNTALGNDGGGLVGVTDCKQTVPLVWALGVTGITATPDPLVFTGTSANVDYVFAANPAPTPGASNGVFVTDLAHVATFTTKGGTLDNQAMKRCSDSVSVPNTAGDGLYPQFFGASGVDRDLCDQTTGTKIAAAQELSKNIAVVAFNCSGTACTLPRLDTASTSDVIDVTGPFYLPIAGDFRFATAQNYASNSLTIELVTQ